MGIVLKGISDVCGIDYDIASGGYRCVLTGSGAAVEGVKAVLSFSEESVLLKLKTKKLELKGKELYIGELCKGFVSVCGEVSSVTLL